MIGSVITGSIATIFLSDNNAITVFICAVVKYSATFGFIAIYTVP